MSAIETYATLYTRRAWRCLTELMDDGVVRSGANKHDVIGWGYDRCYRPHCHAATGGQGLVRSQVVVHHGRQGGLWKTHRLGWTGARQVREMQKWVRSRHNKTCAGYAALRTVPLAHPDQGMASL